MGAVTISRLYGAGGRRAAEAIAGALGYRLVEGDVVEEAARQVGLDPQIAEGFDERAPALLEEAALALAAATPEAGLIALPLDDRVLADRTRDVIRRIGQTGGCVILGRGAQVALADHPGVVHLRFVAMLDDRAERVSRWQGLPAGKARERCKRVDADRAAYMRRFYGVDVDDAALYHAVLNTSRLDLDTAIQLALGVVRAVLGP